MSIESRHLTFFFGAGASRPFGIPTMTEMTEEFASKLKQSGTIKQNQIYSEIVNCLTKDLGNKVDLEAIFSVIEGLKAYQDPTKRGMLVGEFPLYLSWKNFGNSLLQHVSTDLNELEGLEFEFRKFIRERCIFRGDRNNLKKVYTDFFTRLQGKILNTTARTTGEVQFHYDYSWSLFTTNYDACLEIFFRGIAGIKIDTVIPNIQDMNLGTLQLLQHQGKLRLIKLHGSTRWLVRKTGQVDEKEYDLDESYKIASDSVYTGEIVMYPLSQKLLYVYPYIPLFFLLNYVLRDSKVCVVIGYSFRDPVIRNIFSNYISKSDLKIILVLPDATKITGELFPDQKQNFITIDRKFGEKDFEDTNKEIADQLAKL